MTTAQLKTLIVVGSAGVLFGCSDVPTSPDHTTVPDPSMARPGDGRGGGPGSTGPFPATVTLNGGGSIEGDAKGAYVDGSCGVLAETGSTLAQFKPAGRSIKGKERSCGGRTATVTLALQHFSPDPTDHSQDQPISESHTLVSLKTRLDLNQGSDAPTTVNTGRCDTGLELDPREIPGSSWVDAVPNVDSTDWSIRTRPYPDNLAGCLGAGSTEWFHLEFDVGYSRN